MENSGKIFIKLNKSQQKKLEIENFQYMLRMSTKIDLHEPQNSTIDRNQCISTKARVNTDGQKSAVHFLY